MFLQCYSNCSSIISHYHSPIKFNLKSINPLTIHKYYNNKTRNNYTDYPPLQHSTFPFINILNHDFRLYASPNNIISILMQNSELNEDRTDYVELA